MGEPESRRRRQGLERVLEEAFDRYDVRQSKLVDPSVQVIERRVAEVTGTVSVDRFVRRRHAGERVERVDLGLGSDLAHDERHEKRIAAFVGSELDDGLARELGQEAGRDEVDVSSLLR